MWVRTIKVTFANELMKKSIRSYMSDAVDLTEGMLLVYRVDLAANVSLVNHFFSDKETLEAFSEKLKPVREQLKSMGAKVEINDGPVWGFRVAGDVTLDMLSNGMEGDTKRNNHFHTLIRVTPHRHHSPHHIM